MSKAQEPILGFLIPTNRPQVFKELFLQGMENLHGVRDKVMFSFNFQSPWTECDAKSVVDELTRDGYHVAYKFSKYYIENAGAIPFNRIRNDCVELLPKSIEYCALCDDDCQFEEGSAEFINSIIQRFQQSPQLGLIQCMKMLSKDDGIIMYDVDPQNHVFMTGNGFFFRKIFDKQIFPDDALDNIGVGEENIIGLCLSTGGYSVQMCLYSTMEHYPNYKNLGNKEWYKSSVTTGEKGNIAYIRKKYKSIYSM